MQKKSVFQIVFPQIALARWVLTSSWGVRVRRSKTGLSSHRVSLKLRVWVRVCRSKRGLSQGCHWRVSFDACMGGGSQYYIL